MLHQKLRRLIAKQLSDIIQTRLTLARAESGSDGKQRKAIVESIQVDADRLFKMIGEAYVVLSNTTKRSKYDLKEEMWEEMNISVSSSSSGRRASKFYNSPLETANHRSPHESRKTYSNSSHYHPWQDTGILTVAPIHVGKSFTNIHISFLQKTGSLSSR